MTDDQHGDPHGDQHGQGTPPGGSRWDPLPQGDYDDGATAFVKLPEGGVDALLASSDSPLAAPGHGRVAVKAPSARGSVTVTAPPGELALLGYGRRDQARFDARGSKAAIAALESAALGI